MARTFGWLVPKVFLVEGGCVDILSSAQDTRQDKVSFGNPIEQHITADRKAPQASADFRSRPSCLRMVCQHVQCLLDPVDDAVGGSFVVFSDKVP